MAIKNRGENYWLISIYTGKKDDKSQYFHTNFSGTLEEAEAEEKRLKAEYGTLPEKDLIDITVEEYLERWMTDYVKPFKAKATVANYDLFIRLRIVPAIGKLKMRTLTAAHVQRMYRIMITERLDGKDKPLSSSTVNGCHRVLKAAMNQALREGVIKSNPCKLAQAPARAPFEPVIMDIEQTKRFLEAAEDYKYRALFEVAIMTGLRLGELLGLKWQDLDKEAGSLTVRRALKGSGGKAFLAEPKTRSGIRVVPLPHRTMDVLAEHRERQLRMMEKAGDRYNDQWLIFADDLGGFANAHNITNRTLKKICHKARLEPMRFHDLRHSHGTMMAVNSLSPRIISDRLGHADAGFTMKRYTHKTSTSQSAVVKILDDTFGTDAKNGVKSPGVH